MVQEAFFNKLVTHASTLQNLSNKRGNSKTIWGYMIKRLSAYGGCLGSKRR